jgi:hypothetical protein
MSKADVFRAHAEAIVRSGSVRATTVVTSAGKLTIGTPRTETSTCWDVFLDGQKVAEVEQDGDGLFEVEMIDDMESFASMDDALAEIAECCGDEAGGGMGETGDAGPATGSPMQMWGAAGRIFTRRDWSTKSREKMAKTGQALPSGGFPIKTKVDLANAIKSYGRAKDKAAAKAHIVDRAKALKLESMLPASWQ